MYKRNSKFELSAVTIVLIYLFLSLLWIVYTDRLVGMFVHDPELITRIQTMKGWLFVIATSFFLWWLINRANREKEVYRAYTDLLLRLMLTLEPEGDFKTALQTILRDICEEFKWDYGVALVPDRSGLFYKYEVGWHTGDELLQDFDLKVSRYEFREGDGLTGRTVTSKEPQWVERLADDERFREKADAIEAGFHTVLSIPVVVNGTVIAVLMLFRRDQTAPDLEIIRFFSAIGSDIGFKLNRKREKELQDMILQSIPVMMNIFNPKLADFRVNREFERVTGWTNEEISEIDLIRESFPDEELRQRVVEFMKNPGGKWMDMEMTIRSGEKIETTWTNVRLSDNTQIGIGLDITRRKLQERLLEESRDRYAKAGEIGRLGHWENYLKENRLVWSDMVYRIFGLDPETFDPSVETFLSMVHPDDLDTLKEAQERAWSHGSMEVTFRLIKPDGSIGYFHERGETSRDSDGEPLSFSGTVIDVTHLQEAEEQYRILFEQNPYPMWIYDPANLKFVEVNLAAMEHYGYNRNEFLSMTILDLHVTRDTESVRQHVRSLEADQRSSNEWAHLKKSGEEISVLLSGSWILYHGEMFRLVVVNDISNQKKAEKRIIRSMIEGTEQERNRVAKELHDGLGQYLAAARLNVNTLFDDLKEMDLDREIINQFEKGVKQLSHAMEETKRISRNLLPKAVEEFGLSLAVESLVNDLDEGSEIRFSYRSGIEDIHVRDDIKLNIYRVVQEALNNAVRHSGCKNIDVQLMEEEDSIFCTIEDDGSGFEADDEREQGFGLINIQNRVSLLNGQVDIKSGNGRGTVIFIQVPLS